MDSFLPAICSVAVPARLHLGFLDLEGGVGRRFGSLGLSLDGPWTRVHARRTGGAVSVLGRDAERAELYARKVLRHLGAPSGVNLEIAEAIPAHAGLGSGTQLALAVAGAVSRAVGRPLATAEAARLLGRGRRSGIGVGAFEAGGVMLDGGKRASDDPPPILSRMPWPDAWRILLIYDQEGAGPEGSEETSAFAELPPFPAETAGQLCRLMVMAALPALAEQDLETFGRAVTRLQQTIGDYFAPVQGGRFSSPRVAEVLGWIAEQGLAGYGQSSWGPTGFAFLPSEIAAETLRARAIERWGATVEFEVRRGRNQGAIIETAGNEAAANAVANRRQLG